MTKKKIMSILQYVILIILSIISIFPFYWMIVAATNKSVDVSKGTLMIGSHIVENFKSLMASDLNYFGAFKNSIIIAVVTTTLAMIISSAAGYAFEVYKSKARDRVFSVILVSMMIPFAALMIPLFQLFGNFNTIPILSWIRRTWRIWNFHKDFHSNNEINIRSSYYCYIYDKLEQLHVAINFFTVTWKENITTYSFSIRFIIHTWLWNDDGSSCNRNNSNSINLLLNAEELCTGNDRLSKRLKKNIKNTIIWIMVKRNFSCNPY